VTMITEHVRSRLGAQICASLVAADGFLPVITLTPTWETAVLDGVVAEGDDRRFVMAPSKVRDLLSGLRGKIQKHATPTTWPAVLVATEIRPFVRSLLERVSPMTPVISHAELHRKVSIKTIDQV